MSHKLSNYGIDALYDVMNDTIATQYECGYHDGWCNCYDNCFDDD